ncbi:hypothetical protein BKA65DRAFT_560421 [Rhexocercosporidium sp. MPI-PUGE-AT-0058]|nr:hypothetical protein BKA65DRAFT_560421 [Rhexocercosporidium sp. MPI-PUGE-AT-0058]
MAQNRPSLDNPVLFCHKFQSITSSTRLRLTHKHEEIIKTFLETHIGATTLPPLPSIPFNTNMFSSQVDMNSREEKSTTARKCLKPLLTELGIWRLRDQENHKGQNVLDLVVVKLLRKASKLQKIMLNKEANNNPDMDEKSDLPPKLGDLTRKREYVQNEAEDEDEDSENEDTVEEEDDNSNKSHSASRLRKQSTGSPSIIPNTPLEDTFRHMRDAVPHDHHHLRHASSVELHEADLDPEHQFQKPSLPPLQIRRKGAASKAKVSAPIPMLYPTRLQHWSAFATPFVPGNFFNWPIRSSQGQTPLSRTPGTKNYKSVHNASRGGKSPYGFGGNIRPRHGGLRLTANLPGPEEVADQGRNAGESRPEEYSRGPMGLMEQRSDGTDFETMTRELFDSYLRNLIEVSPQTSRFNFNQQQEQLRVVPNDLDECLLPLFQESDHSPGSDKYFGIPAQMPAVLRNCDQSLLPLCPDLDQVPATSNTSDNSPFFSSPDSDQSLSLDKYFGIPTQMPAVPNDFNNPLLPVLPDLNHDYSDEYFGNANVHQHQELTLGGLNDLDNSLFDLNFDLFPDLDQDPNSDNYFGWLSDSITIQSDPVSLSQTPLTSIESALPYSISSPPSGPSLSDQCSGDLSPFTAASVEGSGTSTMQSNPVSPMQTLPNSTGPAFTSFKPSPVQSLEYSSDTASSSLSSLSSLSSSLFSGFSPSLTYYNPSPITSPPSNSHQITTTASSLPSPPSPPPHPRTYPKIIPNHQPPPSINTNIRMDVFAGYDRAADQSPGFATETEDHQRRVLAPISGNAWSADDSGMDSHIPGWEEEEEDAEEKESDPLYEELRELGWGF